MSAICLGNCDNRGVWCGIYCADLGSRLLLSLQRMERKAEICTQTLLYHRLENQFSFIWSVLIFFYNACFLLSPFSFCVCLSILFAQETIKSALPTFWGAVNEKTL